MRIITGSARGTKLRAPKGTNTRPTADRIKESLFNILRAEVQGKTVLDVFAGSGSLGLEALSRGAENAVFIDKDADSIKIIGDNARHTHLADKADIRRGDAFTLLRKLSGENRLFDVIFCDPPYHFGLCQKLLNAVDGSILKGGGLFIAETGADEVLDASKTGFTLLREQTYGATTKINIYKYMAERISEGEIF